MARTCNFELWEQEDTENKEKCGLPIGGGSSTRCAFHAHVDLADPLTNSFIIGQYIRDCKKEFLEKGKRNYLDLTSMRYKGIRFNRVLLPDNVEIRFNKSEFENCRFTSVSFQRSVSFSECVFTRTPFDDIDIKAATINFTFATMSGLAVQFNNCDFQCGEAIAFVGAHIESGTTPFRACYFQARQILFKNCILDTARFYVLIVDDAHPVVGERCLALAGEEIYFDDLKLNGHFEYANYLECKEVSPIVLFSHVNFRQMKTATFIESNLKRAHFTYSRLDSVHFITPQWPERDGRWIIYDELEPVSDTSDAHIKDTYIQLKRNYEDGRRYSEAGEWFYREMECRRRLVESMDANWFVRWMTRKLFSSYKVVSDYGENLVKPFLCIVGLFILWGTFYYYSGFDIGLGPVSYDFACDVTWKSAKGFANALFYSFGIMSFQLTKTAFQHGIASSVLAVTQILLTLILVPLFLLALRRKFRR